MKDNKDQIIQLQKEVIESCENIIALLKDKEKIMQNMIDSQKDIIDNQKDSMDSLFNQLQMLVWH